MSIPLKNKTKEEIIEELKVIYKWTENCGDLLDWKKADKWKKGIEWNEDKSEGYTMALLSFSNILRTLMGKKSLNEETSSLV